MIQRIWYGLLAVFACIAIVLLDISIAHWADATRWWGRLLSHGSVIPLLSALLVLLGAVELKKMLAARGIRAHMGFAGFIICALMLSPWLSAAWLLGERADQVEGLYWQLAWIALGAVGAGVLAVRRGDVHGSMSSFGATMFAIIYLGLLPSFAILIRCNVNYLEPDGAWMLLAILLITKFCDIGGYLVGVTLGRHPLAPSISPNKTIEGTVGGMIASGLLAVGLLAFASFIEGLGYAPWDSPEVFAFGRSLTRLGELEWLTGYAGVAVFGGIVALAGQFGDLLESCFKRDAGFKDSGRIIPGFGGVLDLIDSPTLSFPVAWFLLTAVWRVL